MWPSRSRATTLTPLRRWTVRLSAIFVIVATLLLLLVEPRPSIRELLLLHQRHDFSILESLVDFSSTGEYISLHNAEPTANKLCMPGYFLFVLDGHSPTIIDQNGKLVWQERRSAVTQNLRIQTFRNQEYLTYWTKEPFDHASYYMLDSSYTIRYILSPVGKMSDSLHDFTITHRDTALISAHYKLQADLRAVGGDADGWILDAVFQEIDIATGKLIYEWRASEHVPIMNSLNSLENGNGNGHGQGTEDHPFDYFHINSVDLDTSSGNYLVSSGHMGAVMGIDGSTGRVQWTLGGRGNDFRDFSDRPVVDFVWPHSARWNGNETLTVMDRGRNGAMVIDINHHHHHHTGQATVRQIYSNGAVEDSEGDVQISQDTGTAFVSWDEGTSLSEYSVDGELLCESHLLKALTPPSRITKHTWTGKPTTKPIAKISGHRLYVHWNGATEVTKWQLQIKTIRTTTHQLPTSNNNKKSNSVTYHEIGHSPKTGFQTSFKLPPLKRSSGSSSNTDFFRIAALDQQGVVLGYSDDVEWQQAWTGSDLSQSQLRFLVGVCLFGVLLTVLSTLHIRSRIQEYDNNHHHHHHHGGVLLLPSYEIRDGMI